MGNFKSALWLSLACSLGLVGCDGKTDTTPAGLPVVNLSISSDTISTGQSATLQWTATGAYGCSASGNWQGGDRGVQGSESTGVIAQPGNYSYTLTCTGPGGSQSAVKTLTVVKPGTPSVTLNITPGSINAGQSALLQWTSSNVSSCSVSGRWPNLTENNPDDPRPVSGSEATGILTTAGNYAYTITCQGKNGGTVSDNAVLLVGQVSAPSVTLNLASSNIFAGQATTLSWSSSNATSCTTVGNWLNPGSRPTVNSTPESTGTLAAGSYTYALVCAGPGGSTSSVTRTLNVTTAQAPTLQISVSPASVAPGVSATLNWSSSGVSGNCEASGSWNGSKASSGAAPVSQPAVGAYAYELTCPGLTKQTATLNVVNLAAPVFTTPLTATPAPVTVGNPITLKWAVSNASSCQASGSWSGTRLSSGTETFVPDTPGLASFALSCTGPGGVVSAVPQSVTVNSAVSTAPNISFNCTGGNAYVIPEAANGTGGTTQLCWSVSPNITAIKCKAYGDWTGDRNLNGSLNLGPFTVPGAYNYALQCKNDDTGETTLATQQVTVTPRTTAQPSVTLYASPSPVPFGSSTRLNWTSNNTTSCQASGDPDWTGPKAINSSLETLASLTKTFPDAPSVHHYVIQCSDGKASPSFARYGVVVEAKGPAASISLTATPSTVLKGGSSTLNWTTLGVTHCTAKGEWDNISRDISGTFNTGALNQVRTYAFGLNCTGPGGTKEVFTTVTVTAPAAPTIVFFETNTPVVNPSPKGVVRLRWSSTNATDCTASGSLGTGWTGTKGSSSIGYIEVPAPASVGTYTYNLSCSGAGGSVSALPLSIQVVQPCGLLSNATPNIPNKALLAPSSSVTSSIDGALCLGCNVGDEQNVLTSNQSDYALFNLPVGLIASAELTTTDNSTVYPAGRQFGYVVSVPAALLSAELLKDLSLTTYLNGAPQETFAQPELLDLDLLGLLDAPGRFFVNKTATKPFNGVQITKGAVLSVFPQTYVYGACIVLPNSVEPTPPL